MKERLKDRRTIVLAIVAVAVVLTAIGLRARLYRKVVFGYQRLTETTDTDERARIQERNERIVGRAHYPYDRLEHRPIFPHFWDEYNDYGVMSLYNEPTKTDND